MKKLLAALFLLASVKAWAVNPILGTVQIGTSTVVVPKFQNGAINISSSSIQTGNFPTSLISSGVVTLGGAGNAVTISSNAVLSGALLATSSPGSSGQLLTSNGPGTSPSWAGIPASDISGTTITWTATQTFQKPSTFISSITVLSNGEIDGVFKATGTVTLGGSLNAVTISSNTILPGATFYQNAPIVISTGIVGIPNLNLTGAVIVNQSSTNACGYLIGSTVQTVKAVSNVASVNATTTYAATSLFASITPKCVTDQVFITASGAMSQTTINHITYATIKRGSTDLSTNGSIAEAQLINREFPTLIAIDNPVTVSSTTYTVLIKDDAGGGNANWGDDTATDQTMILQEIAK